MTKEEAKQKLRKSGYNVVEDNSVVTVYISPEKSMKNAIRDVKDKLYSWGYNASFSIKQHKGAEEMIDDLENTIDENEATEEIADEMEAVNEAVEVTKIEKDPKPAAKERATKSKIRLEDIMDDEPVINKASNKEETKASTDDSDDEEWFDEEDSDMLLTEESIQFSLEDFGLDF